MKKLLSLSLVFTFPLMLGAQLFLDFTSLETVPCPNDPNVMTMLPANWGIYQTVDNKWDGPIDNSICFGVEIVGSVARMPLDDVDPARALFMRALFDPVHLWQKQPYNFNVLVESLIGTPTLDLGFDCNNSLCSGMLLLMEVEDETGTSTVERFYPIPSRQVQNDLGLSTCFATDRFGGDLKEVILKFTFDEVSMENRFFDLDFFWIDSPGWFNTFNEEEILAYESQFDGSEYQWGIGDVMGGDCAWGGFNFLFEYPNDNVWPSSDNLGYIPVRPEPNTPEPQTINIIADECNTITIEPFTVLRGAKAVDSDERHTVNLVNNGGEFCLFQVIDLVFEDSANFLFNSGDVNFISPHACFMFHNGGKLKVGEGATFHYGQQGRGILAMFPDAGIELAENASLVIDNRFFLMGYPEQPEQELHMELRPGQSLVFGENGSLHRPSWAYAPVHLNVHMLGGTLDDSNLSAEERLLIRRIYPPTANDFADDVSISPNPNNGIFTVEMNLPQAETVTLEVTDLQGKVVSRREENFPKGVNLWRLEESLASGVYFVKISAGIRTAVKKILVR